MFGFNLMLHDCLICEIQIEEDQNICTRCRELVISKGKNPDTIGAEENSNTLAEARLCNNLLSTLQGVDNELHSYIRDDIRNGRNYDGHYLYDLVEQRAESVALRYAFDRS